VHVAFSRRLISPIDDAKCGAREVDRQIFDQLPPSTQCNYLAYERLPDRHRSTLPWREEFDAPLDPWSSKPFSTRLAACPGRRNAHRWLLQYANP